MAQTVALDVKPSLAEITRETPAIDLKFEETTVQRHGDGVLLQFYRQDDGRMYQVTFKPIPSFCADIGRLLETVKIAVSQQDPDVRFKMEEKTDGMRLHLLVTVRSPLGVEERSLTAGVSITDEEKSMWHRVSREVRRLAEENAALKSRLEHLETNYVVFAIGESHVDKARGLQFSTQLVCNTLYVPIMSGVAYYVDVMDNVRAKSVHLVQHLLNGVPTIRLQHDVHHSLDGYTLFRNKHAYQLILEVSGEHVGSTINPHNRLSNGTYWAWVRDVLRNLGNFPKCCVIVFIVAGSHPPEDVITEFAHLMFVFRAIGKEGCPEAWRCIAERSSNISIEYTS